MLKSLSYLIVLATLTTLVWGQNSLDITYNMELEFQPGDSTASPTVAGISQITIVNRWEKPLDDIYLHNNANGYYESGDPKTARTVLGKITGQNILAVDDSAALSVRISLDQPLEVGDTLSFTVPFTTRLSGHQNPFLPTYGSLGDTTINNLIFFYPILEYFYADGWHTDRHSGKADPHTNPAAYEVSISYPPALKIATSAHTIATDTLADGNLLIKTRYPRANAYSFVLADNFERYNANVRDVDIDIICTPGQSSNAEKIFTELEILIPLYEDQFGPCPNDKLTITMGYSLGENVGALATTNYIIYSNRMVSINTLAHEFAHQWFGSAIAADESFEPWLNESFAEYAARKYMLQRPATIKKQAAMPTVDGFFDLWTDFRSLTNDKLYFVMPSFIGDQALPPIYREGHALKWDNLDDVTSLMADGIVTYYHGSNALLMLEASVGDSMMRRIMLKYTEQYRWRTAQTRDFVQVIRDQAGTEIGDNFLEAITNSHRPDPRITGVESHQADSGWVTTVTTASDGPWTLPWDVQLVTSAGDTITKPGLLLDQSPHTFATGAKIVSIKFAPNGRVIDRNPSNNRWPRKALLQPITGLPNWEYYKLYLRPSIKRDWQGQLRYGITLRGILGANFMPFTPTWFRHSFKLNVNYAPDNSEHQIGIKAAYRMPLAGNPYRQLEFSVLEEYPKSAQILGLKSYLGKPQFYFNGGIARYTQISLTAGHVNYSGGNITAWWSDHEYYYGQIGLRWFRHALLRRTHIATSLLYGSSIEQQSFTKLTLDAEHSRSIINLVAVNLWLEFRNLNDAQAASDLSTRFGRSQSPFSDEEGSSRFRGRTDMEDIRWKNTLTWGISIGNSKPKRFLPKLIAYLDMALANQELSGLLDDQSKLYRAAGIGLEGNSIISYGLYMPLWVSHPAKGEQPVKLRLMGQFRLNW